MELIEDEVQSAVPLYILNLTSFSFKVALILQVYLNDLSPVIDE